MTAIPTFTLNNGTTIPAIGYGTGTKWASNKRASNQDGLDANVIDAVQNALTKGGFTHIDGAEIYDTEEEIGAAIKNSGIPRSQLFITTKVLPKIADPVAALNESLKKLGVDYVDLYLLHAPFVTKEANGIELEDAWKALETLNAEGKAKTIGVSNFRVEDLERIHAIAKVKPAINQIEFNPYLQNQSPGIYKYAQDHGILLQAYTPLGPVIAGSKDENAPLTPILAELGAKYNKTPAQIILRWVYQNNVNAITTSASVDRQRQALDIFDFELTKEELERISDVGATYTSRIYWTNKFDTNNSRL